MDLPPPGGIGKKTRLFLCLSNGIRGCLNCSSPLSDIRLAHPKHFTTPVPYLTGRLPLVEPAFVQSPVPTQEVT